MTAGATFVGVGAVHADIAVTARSASNPDIDRRTRTSTAKHSLV
jgi:hypothetical protein